jgi:hypothetical protein
MVFLSENGEHALTRVVAVLLQDRIGGALE